MDRVEYKYRGEYIEYDLNFHGEWKVVLDGRFDAQMLREIAKALENTSSD